MQLIEEQVAVFVTATWESRAVASVMVSKGISNAGNGFLILHFRSENTLHVYIAESVCNTVGMWIAKLWKMG